MHCLCLSYSVCGRRGGAVQRSRMCLCVPRACAAAQQATCAHGTWRLACLHPHVMRIYHGPNAASSCICHYKGGPMYLAKCVRCSTLRFHRLDAPPSPSRYHHHGRAQIKTDFQTFRARARNSATQRGVDTYRYTPAKARDRQYVQRHALRTRAPRTRARTAAVRWTPAPSAPGAQFSFTRCTFTRPRVLHLQKASLSSLRFWCSCSPRAHHSRKCGGTFIGGAPSNGAPAKSFSSWSNAPGSSLAKYAPAWQGGVGC